MSAETREKLKSKRCFESGDSEEEPWEAGRRTWVGAMTTAFSSPSTEREGNMIGAGREDTLVAWSARGMSGRIVTTEGPMRGVKLWVGGGEEERGVAESWNKVKIRPEDCEVEDRQRSW